MSLTFRKLVVDDLRKLEELVTGNIEATEPGLKVVGSRLLLGHSKIDLVALDAKRSLVLVALDFTADDATLMRVVDAYSWCLEYPDAIRQLYPSARIHAQSPPRVIFIAERLPDAFLRKVKLLSLVELGCFEFQYIEVNGAAGFYLEVVDVLRPPFVPRGQAPAEPLEARTPMPPEERLSARPVADPARSEAGSRPDAGVAVRVEAPVEVTPPVSSAGRGEPPARVESAPRAETATRVESAARAEPAVRVESATLVESAARVEPARVEAAAHAESAVRAEASVRPEAPVGVETAPRPEAARPEPTAPSRGVAGTESATVVPEERQALLRGLNLPEGAELNPQWRRLLDKPAPPIDDAKIRAVRDYLQRELPHCSVYDFYDAERSAQAFHLQNSHGRLSHLVFILPEFLDERSEKEIRKFLELHKLSQTLRQAGTAEVVIGKTAVKVEGR